MRKGQTEQATTRASRVAKYPLELILGLGVNSLADKGVTRQQVQWGLRLSHENVREQEEHLELRFPTGRHYQQPTLA